MLQTSSELDCFASGDRSGNSLKQEQRGQKRSPSTALGAILVPRVAHSAKLLGLPSLCSQGVMLVHGEQGQNLVPKLPKATVWPWEPLGAPVLMLPTQPCRHAGILPELMPTCLTLAVLLGEGKDVPARKTERGDCLPKCTKWTHYSLIFRAGPSNGISCPAHVLKHSDHSRESHVDGRSDLFRRRKEKGEKDSDTSRFSTLTYLWCCREFSVE